MSKNIAIRLADMTYIDSCVEILQDSVLVSHALFMVISV